MYASIVEPRILAMPLSVRNVASSCLPLTRMSLLLVLFPLLFQHNMAILLPRIRLLHQQKQYMLRPHHHHHMFPTQR